MNLMLIPQSLAFGIGSLCTVFTLLLYLLLSVHAQRRRLPGEDVWPAFALSFLSLSGAVGAFALAAFI